MEASTSPAPERSSSGGGRLVRRILIGYGLLLVASWLVMSRGRPEPPVPPDRASTDVFERAGDGARKGEPGSVRLAYRDRGPRDGPTLLMLHGSPGSSYDFRDIAPLLEDEFRLVAPDLPGFGASSRTVGDYSIRAHAAYALDLLDELGIESAHVLGFSMGGGVGLEIWDAAPDRVASLTLLAAIGVEELELLGDHTLNQGIHGLQLAALRAARWLIPHFGALDRSMLSIEYARNFYDSDQRRLRPILEAFEPPMLIVHGERDFLVPLAAAQEHARIVPQAELTVIPAPRGHFIPWTEPDFVAETVRSFVERVEADAASSRSNAAAERVEAAAADFDPKSIPPFEGPAFLAVLALLALATLVSEDLACIAAGLLVADGRIGLVSASAACFGGIFVGDMMLYTVGRLLGRPALRYPPLKWIVPERAVDHASAWFDRKGIAVIFLSRFTPGLRLPTYVAAGILRTRFLTFAVFFFIAGVLWTPALVAVAAYAGERLAESIGGLGWSQLPWIIGLVVVLLELFRIVPLLFTHRGRRMLRGRWLRLTRWEFWPPFITYVPVVLWCLWLSIKYRGLHRPTAANPAMPAGGFVGESKTEILEGLDPSAPEIASFVRLRAADAPAERERAALDFVDASGADFPVIVKPDAGQRGSGVELVPDHSALGDRARAVAHDAMVQERVDGEEFGVFYTRRPSEERGSVFGITRKEFPTVTGDGRRTVEELVLDDPRACALHRVYSRELGETIDDLPAPGEVVRLVEVGTHARGAVFLDGAELVTPELEAAIERIARRYEGFYFGRFDVRAPTAAHLARGEGLRVIELNGVTSEATNVYDPRHSIFAAYRILFRQWELAYAIGAENVARGAPTTSLLGIARAWSDYRRLRRSHRR